MNLETRPGVRTTEFWMTLVQALVGPLVMILVASGLLNPEADPNAISDEVQNIVHALLAITAQVGSVAATRRYTASRTESKRLSFEWEAGRVPRVAGHSPGSSEESK